MIEWFQNLSPTQWLAVGGLLLVAFLNRRPIMDAIQSVLPKPVVDTESDDVAAFRAAKLLQARFQKAGCQEGEKAAKECLSHLFDEHSSPAGS